MRAKEAGTRTHNRFPSCSEAATLRASEQIGRGGVTKRVCLEYVPEIVVGDYALVHVGFAISRIDEVEAQRVFALLREMKELEELSES